MNCKPCAVLAFAALLLGGCSQANASPNRPAASTIPTHYAETIGNTIFDLSPEIPDGFDVTAIPKVEIKTIQSSDREMAFNTYAVGKTITKQEFTPATDDPDSTAGQYSYRFQDGGNLCAGGTTSSYYSAFGYYYSHLLYDLERSTQPAAFPFATIADAEQAVTDAIHNFGYEGEFAFQSIPLDFETAKTLDTKIKNRAAEGEIDKNSYNPNWTADDNAYILYGTQKIGGLPVFYDPYFSAQIAALDPPFNHTIQAISTARGLESLHMTCLFDYTETKDRIPILPFEDIAQAVSQKLNRQDCAEPYQVYRAKLFYGVHIPAVCTTLDAFPMWYFEVNDPQNTKHPLVVLINAATGVDIAI